MSTFLLILDFILIIELLILGWIRFHEDSFFKTIANLKFWFYVSSCLLCFYSFGKETVITETKNNEVIREVFIGK